MLTTTNKAYRAYLHSRKWKRKREACITLNNNRCQRCGRTLESLHRSNRKKRSRFTTNTLQAHHVWYDQLYNEDVEDLRCLCKRPCHAIADRRRKQVMKWLKRSGFWKYSNFLGNVAFVYKVQLFLRQQKTVPDYVLEYIRNGY